jgi:hypothetical protein
MSSPLVVAMLSNVSVAEKVNVTHTHTHKVRVRSNKDGNNLLLLPGNQMLLFLYCEKSGRAASLPRAVSLFLDPQQQLDCSRGRMCAKPSLCVLYKKKR